MTRADEHHQPETAHLRAPPGWWDLLPIGAMTAVATALPPIGGILILGTLPIVGPWLESQGWLGLSLYVLGFVLMAGLALLPTLSQAVLGGWAFGFIWGLPAALLGFAGGSMLAYVLGRSIARDRLTQRIDRHPKWRAVYNHLIEANVWRATLIVALVRLPPSTPFALTNVLMSSARVAWPSYLLGTVIGLMPATALAVFAAAGLSHLDLDQPLASRSNWILAFGIASSLIAVTGLGFLARRALRRLTESGE